MKNHIPTILLAFVFLIQSCGSTKSEIYWINSYTTKCDAGVAKMNCLLVSNNNNFENNEWRNFYTPIEGFKFKPGYFQKIKVKVTTLEADDVPADASTLKYTLVKVLDEEKDTRFELNDIWVAQKINGIEVEKQSNLPQLEINISKMQVMGTDGCNNFTGKIEKLTAIEINFGVLASTRKMCGDMSNTNQFNKAIHNTISYKKKGLTLSFFDEKGKEVLFFKKID